MKQNKSKQIKTNQNKSKQIKANQNKSQGLCKWCNDCDDKNIFVKRHLNKAVRMYRRLWSFPHYVWLRACLAANPRTMSPHLRTYGESDRNQDDLVFVTKSVGGVKSISVVLFLLAVVFLPGTHHLLRLLWLIRLLWLRAQQLQLCIWRMLQPVAYSQVGEFYCNCGIVRGL